MYSLLSSSILFPRTKNSFLYDKIIKPNLSWGSVLWAAFDCCLSLQTEQGAIERIFTLEGNFSASNLPLLLTESFSWGFIPLKPIFSILHVCKHDLRSAINDCKISVKRWNIIKRQRIRLVFLKKCFDFAITSSLKWTESSLLNENFGS